MLLDHFHPPLAERRHWRSFLYSWAVTVAKYLNEQLPQGWYAEPNLVATMNSDVKEEFLIWVQREKHIKESGGVAAVIVVATPMDMETEENRNDFISRWEKWVELGAGFIIVDIVTTHPYSFHAKFLPLLQPEAAIPKSTLYAASYHHVGKRVIDRYYEIWHEPLSIGGPLPTMPLYLKNGPLMPVDLSATYQQALKAVRIDPVHDANHES